MMIGNRRALLAICTLISTMALIIVVIKGGLKTDIGGVRVEKENNYSEQRQRRAEVESLEYEDKRELFAFDPNTADSTALLRLGLRRWQVASIYKYRSRGGTYRKPSDFARLYGLTVHDYRRLEPYIRIAPEYSLPASSLFSKDSEKGKSIHTNSYQSKDSVYRGLNRESQKLHSGEFVDLNEADTSLLKRVPGIGSYYARRIIEYRRRLGGYASIKQLDEIDGFPQDAKNYIRIGKKLNNKLNINKMTLAQLRSHPYFNYYQAKAIVDYRRSYGPLKSLQDLNACPDFTDADLQRISPYVEF